MPSYSAEGRRVVADKAVAAGEAILGANAVTDVDIDHETRAAKAMVKVSAADTAVSIG